jgi:hypothetical protein
LGSSLVCGVRLNAHIQKSGTIIARVRGEILTRG